MMTSRTVKRVIVLANTPTHPQMDITENNTIFATQW